MTAPNPYDLLGVSSSASNAAIKAAYRAKARAAHPDAGGNADEFALLTEAYNMLLDPLRRAEYERTGQWAPAASSVDPNADLYADAGMMLASAISDGRIDPAHDDVLGVIREHLRGQITQIREADAQERRRSAAIRRHRHRLRAEGSKAVLVRLLDDIIKNVDGASQKRAAAIQRNERMIEFFSDVSWSVDERPSPGGVGAPSLQEMFNRMFSSSAT